MRSPIFTIPSGSTDSFQDHENDTIEADDSHDEDDLLDFAVSGQNGSILDEALTHVAQRARPGSSSAASTLKTPVNCGRGPSPLDKWRALYD